jgi:hypothetical protein
MSELAIILKQAGVEHRRQSHELILEAQRRLGVEFPDDLVQFLEFSPSVEFGAEEFWGVGVDVPKLLHLVEMNLKERSYGLPQWLVALRNDGGGRLTCVDTKSGVVVEFDTSTRKTSEFAPSLRQAILEIQTYDD